MCEEIQLSNSLAPHFYFRWYKINLKLSSVGFADVDLDE